MKVPASYSRLTNYERCPKRFHATTVAKSVKEPQNEAASDGLAVHKALELYVSKGEPLPARLKRHEASIQQFLNAPGERATEFKMAVDQKFEPCGWFDYDVYLRAVADLSIVHDKDGVLVDYKGLPVDTELPTPRGWTTMKAVSVGDELLGGDGLPCIVTGKSKAKTLECFRLTFDDKSEVVCDEEHLWLLHDGNVVPVTQLRLKDKICCTSPVQLLEADLPIDPYVFGLWLADGKHTSGEVTKPDPMIWEEVVRRGYEIGGDISGPNHPCPTRTIKKIRGHLTKLGVRGNKYIPQLYLRASYAQRLDLLKGLMDGDGSVNTVRKQAIFTNTSKQLVDGVEELLLSLGQRPLVSAYLATGFNKTVQAYSISFRPNGINPFYLSRKADRVDQSWGSGQSWYRKITKIEKLPAQQTQCVSVDSGDNTYLCTRKWVPTHNTGKMKNDFEQLEFTACMLFWHYPQLETVMPAYFWLARSKITTPRDGQNNPKPIQRSEIPWIWQKFQARLDKYQQAHDEMNFPPRTGWQCKGCPVTQCPYFERR